MGLAQEHASMLNHDYIGTEHLLLGLIGERRGVAARALASLGITVQAARQQVEAIIGQGQQAPAGHFTFTPQAGKVLELSSRQGRELGHNYVGTEHILLGLIREGDGVALQVLNDLGVDPETVRQEVIDLLLSDLLDRINVNSLEWRFSALEQRVGTGPDMRDLDREIAQVRRDKESAIEAQDFENAVALRDRETRLLDDQASRQQEWATPNDLPPLNAQVERLRALLRQPSIDAQDDVP
jgi:ATP-dependent Clp protease ATP-binding subunit ClpA